MMMIAILSGVMDAAFLKSNLHSWPKLMSKEKKDVRKIAEDQARYSS